MTEVLQGLLSSDITVDIFKSDFLARIMREKELRRQEIDWILQERQENARAQEWIDEQIASLKSREAKLAGVDLNLIPSVRQLQQIGATFEMIQNYIWLVNERSVLGNITTQQAASFLLSEFRELKNLGSILRKKQEARQELAKFGEQRQVALTVLTRLLVQGATESQIALLATDCWYQHQHHQQPNGNIQQPLDNNGYGGGLSMSDFIRLNLLKGATTNALNKIY